MPLDDSSLSLWPIRVIRRPQQSNFSRWGEWRIAPFAARLSDWQATGVSLALARHYPAFERRAASEVLLKRYIAKPHNTVPIIGMCKIWRGVSPVFATPIAPANDSRAESDNRSGRNKTTPW